MSFGFDGGVDVVWALATLELAMENPEARQTKGGSFHLIKVGWALSSSGVG
jgi:hypothetical protein